MTTKKQLGLCVGFDRELVWTGGGSVRYAVVRVSTPAAPPAARAKRHPLNLSIVIDASGSMGGGRLDAAKRAAMDITERLNDGDRLSVVSFSDDVQVHLDGCVISDETRNRARAAIIPIETRDCTNLCAGWLGGAECAAKASSARANAVNRVLVLTDGHANEGETNPAALSKIAAGLFERGIITSTVGIGNNYSTTQIRAMAEHGGGRMHDAELPGEIAEVVMGEFGEIVNMYAEQVELTVKVPVGVDVAGVGDLALAKKAGRLACRLGALSCDRTRTVVLRFTCPPGAEGKQLKFTFGLSWRRPGKAETFAAEPACLSLSFAGEAENGGQPRDLERSMTVAERWQMAVIERAIQYNEDGAYGEARKFIEMESKFFERYCAGLPEAGRLVEEMKAAATPLSKPMDARWAKNATTSCYTLSRDVSDHRSMDRGDWRQWVFHGIDAEPKKSRRAARTKTAKASS